jgi:hypothetical protein
MVVPVVIPVIIPVIVPTIAPVIISLILVALVESMLTFFTPTGALSDPLIDNTMAFVIMPSYGETPIGKAVKNIYFSIISKSR